MKEEPKSKHFNCKKAKAIEKILKSQLAIIKESLVKFKQIQDLLKEKEEVVK